MGEKLNIQTNLVKNEVKNKKVNKHALKKKIDDLNKNNNKIIF